MNDYNLINSLLEDGSPQAILKLKMVVDLQNRIMAIRQIKLENLKLFCETFKEDYVISESLYFFTIKYKSNGSQTFTLIKKNIIVKTERNNNE